MNTVSVANNPGGDSRLRRSIRRLAIPWKRLFSINIHEPDIFERAHASTVISSQTPSHWNSEDYTRPTLVSTTEIVTDSTIDYASVKVISCERERRGSVITNSLFHGLSRRNSSYSTGGSVSNQSTVSMYPSEGVSMANSAGYRHSQGPHTNFQRPSITAMIESSTPPPENAINCYSFVEMVHSDSRYLYNAPEYINI